MTRTTDSAATGTPQPSRLSKYNPNHDAHGRFSSGHAGIVSAEASPYGDVLGKKGKAWSAQFTPTEQAAIEDSLTRIKQHEGDLWGVMRGGRGVDAAEVFGKPVKGGTGFRTTRAATERRYGHVETVSLHNLHPAQAYVSVEGIRAVARRGYGSDQERPLVVRDHSGTMTIQSGTTRLAALKLAGRTKAEEVFVVDLDAEGDPIRKQADLSELAKAHADLSRQYIASLPNGADWYKNYLRRIRSERALAAAVVAHLQRADARMGSPEKLIALAQRLLAQRAAPAMKAEGNTGVPSIPDAVIHEVTEELADLLQKIAEGTPLADVIDQIAAIAEAAGGVTVGQLGLPDNFAWANVRRTFEEMFPELRTTVEQSVRDATGSYARQVARRLVQAANPRTPQTMEEAARALRDIRRSLTRSAALRITRTETARVYGMVAQETMRRNQVDARRWLTAEGSPATAKSPVCPTCLANAARGRVPMDEMYRDVYGNEIETAPAHPQCLVAGTEVVAPDARRAYVRGYEGIVVTLCTARGKQLTVTPNHPVLTSVGFRPAGLLREGDYLVGGSLLERVASSVDKDVDNSPSTVEDKTRALAMSSDCSAVPTSSEDFHGDAVDGQVCIIFTNRLLKYDVRWYGTGDHVPQYQCSGRHVSPVGSATSLLLDSESADSEGFRAPMASSSRPVSRCDISPVLIRRSLPHHGTVGLGLRTQLDAPSEEPLPYHITRSAIPPPQRRKTLSSEVQVEDLLASALDSDYDLLIGTSTSWHALAPVYNFETMRGYYTANGIVTSNCRCETVPDPKQDDGSWWLPPKTTFTGEDETLAASVVKYNPNHDAQGRFSSGRGFGADSAETDRAITFLRGKQQYDPASWTGTSAPWNRSKQDFIDGKVKGFKYDSSGGSSITTTARNDTSVDGTIRVYDAFFRQSPDLRKLTIMHELGHNPDYVMRKDGSADRLLEPFKTGEDRYSVSWAIRTSKHEVLAQSYSELFDSSPRDMTHPSDKPKLELLTHIADISKKLDLPVPVQWGGSDSILAKFNPQKYQRGYSLSGSVSKDALSIGDVPTTIHQERRFKRLPIGAAIKQAEDVLAKFNPNHDARGRFATGSAYASIPNRGDVLPGTKLVVSYKGTTTHAEVVNEKGGVRITDGPHAGEEFKSVSAAGRAVTGTSVNGWRFWSIEETNKQPGAQEPPKPKPPSPKPPSKEGERFEQFDRRNFFSVAQMNDYMNRKYEGVKFYLQYGDIDIDTAADICTEFDTLAQQYPRVISGRWVRSVVIRPPMGRTARGAYAQYVANSELRFSPQWFGRGERTRAIKNFLRDEAGKWHPKGTGSYRGIVSHEFGHAVSAMVRYHAAARTGGDVFSKFLADWAVDKVSRYGRTSSEEGFAEAISAIHHTPEREQSSTVRKLRQYLKEEGYSV